MNKQSLLVILLFVWCVVLYSAVVVYGTTGHIVPVVIAALLSSPVLLFALRVTAEEGLPAGLFDPKTQSWSFLFGDTFLFALFVLPVVVVGHRRIDAHNWYHSGWWIVGCLIIGFVAGYAFHTIDGGNYAKAGAELALNSPTKLAHDFVAYPVLLGGLLCLGIPVLLYEFKWLGVLGIVGLLGFGLMVAHDAVSGLDPHKLHPRWDTKNFRVITR